MTPLLQGKEFIQYDENGISVRLPAILRVVYDAPRLFAAAPRGGPCFMLDFNPEKGVQDTWEDMLAKPQGTIPQLTTTVIRERQITHPYKGLERIIEHRLVDRPNSENFGWLALFYPGESFLMTQVVSKGTFQSTGSMWQTVIDSIRVAEA